MSDNIPIPDFRDQLRLRAAAVTGIKSMDTGEEDVPRQLAQMAREKQEKKLLKYQVEVNKGDVNSFLLAKYGDGKFNKAYYDGYDNTPERLKNGITYNYHIFFNQTEDGDGNDVHAGNRPPAEYLITPEIKSKTGDTYVYHIPVHYADKAKSEIATDIDDEHVDSYSRSVNGDGLVHALQTYRDNVRSGRNHFTHREYSVLKKHGFIKDGKFDGTIKGKMVQKYFKNLNDSNRHAALEYLNAEFKKRAADEAKEAEKEKKDEPKDETEDDAPDPAPDAPSPDPALETVADIPVEAIISIPEEKPAAKPAKKAKKEEEEELDEKPALSRDQLRKQIEAILKPMIDSLHEVSKLDDLGHSRIERDDQKELDDDVVKYSAELKKITNSNVSTKGINQDVLLPLLKDYLDKTKKTIQKKKDEHIKYFNAANVATNASLEKYNKPLNDADEDFDGYGVFVTYRKGYEKELKKAAADTFINHARGSDIEKELAAALGSIQTKYTDVNSTFIQSLKKLNAWKELLGEYNALTQSSVKTKIGIMEDTIAVVENALKSLDLAGATKKLTSVKGNDTKYQLLKDDLVKHQAAEKRKLAKIAKLEENEKKKAQGLEVDDDDDENDEDEDVEDDEDVEVVKKVKVVVEPAPKQESKPAKEKKAVKAPASPAVTHSSGPKKSKSRR